MSEFKVSETMKVIYSETKKVDYIVLKIGDKCFSTNYEDIKKGTISGMIQIVDTKNIGEQTQIWTKGTFSEGKNHEKLATELPFELNIYFHGDK